MSIERKKLLKHCDDLWKLIVKERAGYISELSGLPARPAHPHHCKGKDTYALRFDIRGGICLTSAEHYKAHATDSYDIQLQMREYLKRREGENIIELLEIEKNYSNSDLGMIEIRLKQQLKEIRGIEKNNEHL